MSTQEKYVDTKMEKLKSEKESANELQSRKHQDWNDNYELYRNKVRTNRLTQRQAVNIPLMKETVKTILGKIDDAPEVDWKEMGGDADKEIVYQEIWNSNFRQNKLELEDVKDKKNVLLYGISTKFFNINENGIEIKVLDPYDVVFDPLMEVGNVETARFIVRQNIFRSLREILADDRYTKEGKEDLKIWIDSPKGITQSHENKEQYEKRMERLQAMGVTHKDFPLFAGGDRLVNLTEHYTETWDTDKQVWERRVVVYADDEIELMDEPLKDLIGDTFWPFQVWVEDPETTDIYSDSIADLVRTPNKVLNVWFSQMIENRTLKNFQMHWFLPGNNYTPQTYTPGPGAMLPAPPGEDINKVIKPVEVSGLDDTMGAIQALTTIVERATGATAIEKGQSTKGEQTLGEVELLAGKSIERAVGMAKFYRMAWYETAVKWHKLMHANRPKVLKLYKIGGSGRMYSKNIYQSDWVSEDGYEPLISSSSEQDQNQIRSLQKWQYVTQQYPDNQALKRIALRRQIDALDVTPQELSQINEDFNKSMQPEPQPTPQAQPSPMQEQNVTDVESLINELAA